MKATTPSENEAPRRWRRAADQARPYRGYGPRKTLTDLSAYKAAVRDRDNALAFGRLASPPPSARGTHLSSSILTRRYYHTPPGRAHTASPPRPRQNVTNDELPRFTRAHSDRIGPCVTFRPDEAPTPPPAPSATSCWKAWRPTAACTCPKNTRPCRFPTWTSCASSCARKATRPWPPASSPSSSTTSTLPTCARSRPAPTPPPPSPTRRSCPSPPWKAPTCTSPTSPTAPPPPSKTWRCSSSANSSNTSSPAAATGSPSSAPPPVTPAPPPSTRCEADAASAR